MGQYLGQKSVNEILEITDADIDAALARKVANARSNAALYVAKQRIDQLLDDVEDPAVEKLLRVLFALNPI